LPRFATSTELFELVGVVDGKQLTVYLDRFDDNVPVKGAKLELEIGGSKVGLIEQADGEFHGSLAKELASGITPVTATVVVGKDSDLLAAELDIHDEAHEAHAPARGWKSYLGWGSGALLVLAGLAWISRRTRLGRRTGGAA